MEKYYTPNFWANLLGMLTFYDVVMGCGSIWENENGEMLVILPSTKKTLACGCPGAEHFILDKTTDSLQPIDHASMDNFIPKTSIANRFQSTFSTNFWDDFYEKFPYKKPIKIINN